jgi:hypothetical protein
MPKKLILSTCLLLLLPATSHATENVFLGTWTIQSAIIAPWVTQKQTDLPVEVDALLDKTVSITRDRISGPAIFDCNAPAYAVEELAPDVIFEGGLALDPANPVSEPSDDLAAARATKLGFDPLNVLSLGIRCSELSLHMLDPKTVMFAINNKIYTMVRNSN